MSRKSASIQERDSESPWQSAKLPNLAENWENPEKECSDEEGLLQGIDQMACVNNPISTDNALESFQSYRPIQKQNVIVLKYEIQRGRVKLKERREIITMFNEEMPNFVKTISTHT